ncbi:hypothetical protein [Erythrobacter aureus]|uniref:hypothetical protein n=1 Tax=Erythrobacter aureus TaxID=2182384 RepID=UPI003A925166
MSQTYDFYAARAREARAAAEEATLDNVRQREMRAAATWTELADQARRVAEGRAKVEREKAAARDALATQGG